MEINETIERFIVEELLVGGDETQLDHDKSLISSGILDSLALLQLVEFLNDRFGAEVEDEELLPENFQTINRITEFVKEKTENA